MKVLVPVKQVAILEDRLEVGDRLPPLGPESVELALNEWDAFALEAAVRIGEAAGGGSETVAVTVGDDHADEVLRLCLAKGAGRAVRVWSRDLEGADPLATARVLAAVVQRESPDLVLCGAQSSDSVNGATGTAIAGFCRLARVAVVRSIAVDADDRYIQAHRELEGGSVEAVRVRLPALLTVQTGTNEPRYATFRAIKQAEKEELEVLGLPDLGLDSALVAAAAGSQVRCMKPAATQAAATMLSGGPEAIGSQIADLIRERLA